MRRTRRPSRREFLTDSASAGGWLLAAAAGLLPYRLRADDAPKKTSLLILGGTGFLGPQVVDAAKKSGWTLTLFNRGKTNPGLFPDLEQLHGDRNVSLAALEGRRWDAVVDTSGYFPRQIRMAMDALQRRAGQYVFVSSISVYADTSKPGMDETAKVATIADEATEKITEESFGALKALCEKAAEAAMPGRVTIIRPGLIVGPGDPSDRFTYWPVRVTRGGEVLAPGTSADPVQFVDVRDLGTFIVKALDTRSTGVFNATGPATPLPIGTLLGTCKAVSGSDARFTWVDAAFLAKMKVVPFVDMPVWEVPEGETAGANRVSIARAAAKGLTFRPLPVTVKDTLDWWRTLPKERQEKLKAGISSAREAEVLKAWHERAKAAAGAEKQ